MLGARVPDSGEAVGIEPQDLDDASLKRELDEALGEFSQDELERASVPEPTEPYVDEKGRIHGRILDIRGVDVFVDIGGRSEGFLTLDDFDADHPPIVGEARQFVMQGFDRESGLMRLSLRERANGDCVLWQGTCTAYPCRPAQCRTFPFWKDGLRSRKTFELVSRGCPGVDRGRRYTCEEILRIAAGREDT